MTVDEAYQRGNNLLATGVVAFAGVAFLPEFFLEDEWWHKVDEGALFLLGVAAIVWYLTGRKKFTRSLIPVGLVVGALVAKVVGFILEIGDPEDLGDDFGALILFVLASITVIVIYVRSSRSGLVASD